MDKTKKSRRLLLLIVLVLSGLSCSWSTHTPLGDLHVKGRSRAHTSGADSNDMMGLEIEALGRTNATALVETKEVTLALALAAAIVSLVAYLLKTALQEGATYHNEQQIQQGYATLTRSVQQHASMIAARQGRIAGEMRNHLQTNVAVAKQILAYFNDRGDKGGYYYVERRHAVAEIVPVVEAYIKVTGDTEDIVRSSLSLVTDKLRVSAPSTKPAVLSDATFDVIKRKWESTKEGVEKADEIRKVVEEGVRPDQYVAMISPTLAAGLLYVGPIISMIGDIKMVAETAIAQYAKVSNCKEQLGWLAAEAEVLKHDLDWNYCRYREFTLRSFWGSENEVLKFRGIKYNFRVFDEFIDRFVAPIAQMRQLLLDDFTQYCTKFAADGQNSDNSLAVPGDLAPGKRPVGQAHANPVWLPPRLLTTIDLIPQLMAEDGDGARKQLSVSVPKPGAPSVFKDSTLHLQRPRVTPQTWEATVVGQREDVVDRFMKAVANSAKAAGRTEPMSWPAIDSLAQVILAAPEQTPPPIGMTFKGPFNRGQYLPVTPNTNSARDAAAALKPLCQELARRIPPGSAYEQACVDAAQTVQKPFIPFPHFVETVPRGASPNPTTPKLFLLYERSGFRAPIHDLMDVSKMDATQVAEYRKKFWFPVPSILDSSTIGAQYECPPTSFKLMYKKDFSIPQAFALIHTINRAKAARR